MTTSPDYAGTISKGTHTLKGQAFSLKGATGQALGSLQISFTVTDDGSQPPPDDNLPTGWIAGDVGSVGAAGSTSFNNGTWTVKGDGADIWGSADSFQFARQNLSGNGSITVRVASMQNTDVNAKAGIMIRESSASGSKEASIVVTPSNGIKFLRRTSTGGATSVTTVSSLKAPYYLRLTRSGSTITAQYSANGTTWTTLGSISLSMNSDVLIGLAVSSHKSGTLNTSVFDNVTVS
jgi:regulation of enolase protein 1 (concanavalin A-like superfamily)